MGFIFKTKKDLEELIHKSTLDGEISASEDESIKELAKKVNVGEAELNEMIKADLLAHLKLKIDEYASDCDVSKEEMLILKKKADSIGIDETELKVFVDQALSKYKAEKMEAVKSTLGVIGFFTAATAIGIGVLKVLAGSGESSSNETGSSTTSSTASKAKPKKAPCTCKCTYCGRRISEGSTIYTYYDKIFCCLSCYTNGKNG